MDRNSVHSEVINTPVINSCQVCPKQISPWAIQFQGYHCSKSTAIEAEFKNYASCALS